MLRIVIVDDELAARRRLKRLIDGQPGFDIVGEFADGTTAIEGIRRLRPDVAILDIQMPGCDGLEVATTVAERAGPAVVFVTAFDQYALKAFEVHAVDYLVKPVDPERLQQTLERLVPRANDSRSSELEFLKLARMIEELRRTQERASLHDRKRPRDRLLVAVQGKSILIPTTEIDWVEAAGNYVRLHRGTASLMLRESLASVETSLDAQLFARVHRSAVVNIAKIKEVQPWFSGAAILILTTGQRLTVSRSYRKQFESRFGIQTDD
jgi:two-component system, LytTR family, response regulator